MVFVTHVHGMKCFNTCPIECIKMIFSVSFKLTTKKKRPASSYFTHRVFFSKGDDVLCKLLH